MPEGNRRALGAHYTPAALADRLVDLALRASGLGAGELPQRVCDPSCGAGSILVSLAEELHARGASPAEVLERLLIGCDIDPAAVRAARESLLLWAASAGEADPPEPRVLEADALALPADFPEVDLVVGNPPFASPLSADVARRRKPGRIPDAGSVTSSARERGAALSAAEHGAYVDDSALHLKAAVELVAPGGVVCLLQPQSLLASRDAASVRAAVSELAVIEALWASAQDLFEEASVRVCAPVLVRRREGMARRSGGPMESSVLWDDEAAVAVSFDPTGSWAPLLAGVMGTPRVGGAAGPSHGDDVVSVGDLARCTAGFRDEFYALASVAFDSSPGERARRGQGGLPGVPRDDNYRLITAGMVDPGMLRWGTGSWKLAGERYVAPVADPGLLEETSPRVGRWSAARAVPKVLVASQTKVIEAAVDRTGCCVPVTPVVSVETSGDCSPAALAAMLSAPSNSALLATGAAGSGRGSGALRVGASAVAELRASGDPQRWLAAEWLWARFEAMARSCSTPEEWSMIGVELDALIGCDPDDRVVTWWVDRLPGRVVQREHLT